MSDKEFRGDAPARAEITTVEVTRFVPGSKYGLRAYNVPPISVATTNNDNIATVRTRLRDAINAAGLSASGESLITVTTPAGLTSGLRIDSSAGNYVQTIVPGVSPIAKEVRVTLPDGTTGGTFDLTFDFGSGAETATLAADFDTGAMETEIDGLASLSAADSTVSLEQTNPLTYRIKIGGTVAGVDWTVTGDGADLIGAATCEIGITQEPGDNTTEVQALWFAGRPINDGNLRVRFSRGGTVSAWVNSANALNSSSTILPLIQSAVDSVVGANRVEVIGAYMDIESSTSGSSSSGSSGTTRDRRGGVFILKWLTTGAQDQVSIEAQIILNNVSSEYATRTLQSSSQTIREAGGDSHEFLLVQVNEASDSTNYGLTYNGVTSTQPVGTSAATLDSGFVTLFSGDVTLWTMPTAITAVNTGTRLYILQLETEQNFSATTGTNCTVTKIVDGAAPINQIQQIIIRAESGTIRFAAASAPTTWTSELAYNVSAADLQTALRGLAAIGSGNCNVSGSGTPADPFVVEFVGSLAGTSPGLLVHDLAIDDDLAGGYDPLIAVTTTPVAGVAQVDQIWLDETLNGGYVTPVVEGRPGNRVAWNGNAAAWESAIEAVPSSGCTVSGTGTPLVVVWDAVGPRTLTVDNRLSTVSTSSLLKLKRVQTATGPNHWHEPLNWSTESVPGSGDTAILRDGSVAINEGLRQRCVVTVDTGTGDLIMGTDITDSGDFVPGQAVYLRTTNAFPAATGLTISAGTVYYIRTIDELARTVQLSTAADGNAIEFTSAGTGVHTMEVVLAGIETHLTWRGQCGLSRRRAARLEERPRWLALGATLVDIGLGTDGSGHTLLNLDLGPRAATINQNGSGQATLPGELPTNLRIVSDSSPLTVTGGLLAVSPTDLDSEQSELGAVVCRNATVLLGKCEIASYVGQGDVLLAPYGFTCGGLISRS